MLSGKTTLIAHIGYPTSTFKAPLIYNPWFESKGIDACVVPMGVKAEDYPTALKYIFKFSNIHGALITMPHKVTTVSLVDEVSTTAQIAGAANAVLLRKDGTLLADMFDGEGFVRGAQRKGFNFAGSKCLVVGAGGVGSAIAASMAAAGVAKISLFDVISASAEKLGARLQKHYPKLEVVLGGKDPAVAAGSQWCHVLGLDERLPNAADGWQSSRCLYGFRPRTWTRAPVLGTDGGIRLRTALDCRIASRWRCADSSIRCDRRSTTPQSSVC